MREGPSVATASDVDDHVTRGCICSRKGASNGCKADKEAQVGKVGYGIRL